MTFSWIRRDKKQPDDILPDGWQFYSRPNNAEPPGTVFRIAPDGKRFIESYVKPEIMRSAEPGVSIVRAVSLKAGVIARFLGLESLSADISSGRAKVLQYEITSPERAVATDAAIRKVIDLDSIPFKTKNRYFVIREVRSATALRFALTDEYVGELGGKAKVVSGLQAGVKLEEKAKGTYELTLGFPERLGVMFLPDEISASRAGLAKGASTLGFREVREVLEWSENT